MAGRVAGGCGAHHNGSAFCRNRATVFNQRALAFGAMLGRNGHLQETIAREIERRLLARTKADLADRHCDQPAILDGAADQRRIAAAPDRDHSLVGNGSGGAVAVEAILAFEKILVGDIQG